MRHRCSKLDDDFARNAYTLLCQLTVVWIGLLNLGLFWSGYDNSGGIEDVGT